MKRLVLLLSFLFAFYASAGDRSGQLGIGGALGGIFAAPWAEQQLRNTTSLGPRASLYGRFFHGEPISGYELAYDYFRFTDNDMRADAITFSWFFRYFIDINIHPFFSFGLGGIRTQNYYITAGSNTNATFKFRFGMEYELNPNVEVGVYLDHFSAFKHQEGEPSIHALSPVLGATWYFGESMPIGGSSARGAAKSMTH